MGKTIQNFRAKAQQFFSALSKGQKFRLFFLTLTVLVIAVFLYFFVSYKPYSVLYAGMNASDAGDVLSVLEEMGVDAKVEGSDTVLVQSDKVDEVRMKLAAQGYPESGYNYDIFMKASGLGTTDYEKKVYLQFQLQENLRKTILKLNKVEDAVVNINLSEDSAFVISQNRKSATAAVMLTLRDGSTISSDEAKAIAELVCKSVSGLAVENVRIIDSKMHLYSLDDATGTQNVGSQLDLQTTVRNNLQKQVLNMLSPIFGDGSVLVEVGVTLNFDTTITESVVFAPPVEGQTEGLVVSMSELAEVIQNYGTSPATGTTGTSSNGTDTYQSVVDNSGNAVYKKISKDANYELNQTKTQIESAKGKIEKLSVSVVLDSSANSADYTDKVKKLVANAVGVSIDNITVEMLPFQKLEQNGGSAQSAAVQADLLKQAQKASLIRLIIIVGASFVGFLMLIFTLRSLFKPKTAKRKKHSKKGVVDEETVMEFIPQDSGIEDFEFGTKEDGNLEKLGKYIDKSPESVAQLLRSWIAEDVGR